MFKGMGCFVIVGVLALFFFMVIRPEIKAAREANTMAVSEGPIAMVDPSTSIKNVDENLTQSEANLNNSEANLNNAKAELTVRTIDETERLIDSEAELNEATACEIRNDCGLKNYLAGQKAGIMDVVRMIAIVIIVGSILFGLGAMVFHK